MDLLESIVCSAERLCEGKLCCLEHRRKVCALCLLYKTYHRMDHPMSEYLNHFIAARNTRASAALGELAFVIPGCRTDQFSRSLLPAAVRLRNLLLLSVVSGGTLCSLNSAMNICLLKT